MTHTNADLLGVKTKKGTFYSEAVMLQTTFRLLNKVNNRKDGHADTRELYTPEKIKIMKQRGNENFADKTFLKFW
jgi:hypothetical protein